MNKNVNSSKILTDLYSIGVALTSERNVQDVLVLISKFACELTGAELSSCYQFNEETGRYSLAADPGRKITPDLHRIPRADGLTAHIVSAGTYKYSNNAQNEEPFCLSPFTQSERIHSVLGIPLLREKETVGVLYINYRKPNMINGDVIAIAQLLASQAAVAVSNARLFKDLQEREASMIRLVEVHNRVSSVIASGKVSSEKPIVRNVLDEISETACEVLEADCSVFYPLDVKRNNYYDLSQVSHWGLRHPLQVKDRPRSPFGMSEFISREGLIVRQDIEIEDPEMLKSGFISREEIKAFVGVLLAVDSKKLGVLFVNYRSARLITQDDIRVITAFSNQIALTVQIARLLEEERKARSSLEMLALMEKIGAAFAHRVIGAMGTVPVNARMIKRRLKELGINEKYFEDTLTQIETDASIVNKMATVLKKLPNMQKSPEMVNVNDIVKQEAEKWDSRSTLKLSLDPKIPFFEISKLALAEVVENVLSNAVQHTPSMDDIHVSTLYIDHIEIHVKDSGTGLTREKAQRIFEPFYSEREGGLGFGLWWSITFMKKIGGDIQVVSDSGKGSVFKIVFPKEPK